ncbi:hypothetical protein KAR91_48860 [Candidatus Pacearchaeota archaeon]|nr:hypothetical protein [Candidatus Pacearchaeota archaeon]
MKNDHWIDAARYAFTNPLKGGSMETRKSLFGINTPSILAIALLVLAFALFFIVILIDVAQPVRDITMVIIGLVGGNLGQVYSFYFGSSEGSRAKDDIKSVTTKEL